MIARTWHGIVRPEDAERYHAYLFATGVPECRNTPGNRDVFVLRRRDQEGVHFLFISLWESWEAIRVFAGSDVETARYFPEDERYLLELEPHVTHYEALEAP